MDAGPSKVKSLAVKVIGLRVARILCKNGLWSTNQKEEEPQGYEWKEDHPTGIVNDVEMIGSTSSIQAAKSIIEVERVQLSRLSGLLQ